MSETPKPWLDVRQTQSDLATFFSLKHKEITKFGSTVNQTFEALLFASLLSQYRERGWEVAVKNPLERETGMRVFRLKFSTRGRPENYSYALCTKGDAVVEVRHQLRVATNAWSVKQQHRANLCLDVAVIKSGAAEGLRSDDAVKNNQLVTFAEAKHMNAYAELVAGFIGVVHELQPYRLDARSAARGYGHPKPFLFVSGFLLHTARGILETIKERKFGIALYHLEAELPGGLKRRMREAVPKVEAGVVRAVPPKRVIPKRKPAKRRRAVDVTSGSMDDEIPY